MVEIRASQASIPVAAQPRATGAGVAAQAQAVGDLSRGLSLVGDAAQRVQEQQAAVYGAKALSDAKVQWTRTMIERRDAAKDDAAGFATGMASEFEDYKAGVLAMAPPAARDRLDVALTEFGGRLSAQAMEFEAAKRVSHRSDMIGATIQQNANVALVDPEQVDSLLEDTLSAIDAMGLPDDKARALRDEAKSGITAAAFNGLIESNPSAALDRKSVV